MILKKQLLENYELKGKHESISENKTRSWIRFDGSRFNQKGIYFKGIFGRRIWETWEHLAALVESKKISLTEIITHKFPLDQYQGAFQQINKNAGKILLIP